MSTALAIAPPARTPTALEYHADLTRWSSSGLKTFRNSPALAWGQYIAKTIPRKPPTPAMIKGSLVHLLATQPEEVGTQVYEVDCKTRGAKEFKAAVEAYPARMVVTSKEFTEACAVVSWLDDKRPKSLAAAIAKNLLRTTKGYAEYAFSWEDSSGVPMRGMADRLVIVNGKPAIIEFKTTTDPSPKGFAKQVMNFDYHCQAALYIRGLSAHLGVELLYFWIAVRNEPPHEVGVYRPDGAFLALGRQQIDEDLDSLSGMLDMDPSVPWTAEWEDPAGDLPVLEPPYWATKKLAGQAIYDS